jgi:hypothetical protein
MRKLKFLGWWALGMPFILVLSNVVLITGGIACLGEYMIKGNTKWTEGLFDDFGDIFKGEIAPHINDISYLPGEY